MERVGKSEIEWEVKVGGRERQMKHGPSLGNGRREPLLTSCRYWVLGGCGRVLQGLRGDGYVLSAHFLEYGGTDVDLLGGIGDGHGEELGELVAGEV